MTDPVADARQAVIRARDKCVEREHERCGSFEHEIDALIEAVRGENETENRGAVVGLDKRDARITELEEALRDAAEQIEARDANLRLYKLSASPPEKLLREVDKLKVGASRRAREVLGE